MNDQPLVSAITIFLDGGRFLEQAIESVLAQTYDGWELLLIDDGSTDESTSIARRYAERHPDRIRYFEHDGHRNRGMSASRNLGISHARGALVAFLDADDVWLPQKLEVQVRALSSQPEAAMVYGPTLEWHGWTGDPADAERDFVQDLGVPTGALIRPPRLVPRVLENEARSPRTCSVLLRRDAILRVGGFEDRFRGMYEDQAFFAKLCLTEPVLALGQTLDKYRQHKDGCCRISVDTGRYYAARKAYLQWLSRHLSAQPITDGEVWRVLQQERRRYPNAIVKALSNLVHALRQTVRRTARLVLPRRVRRWIWSRCLGHPDVGGVRFGHLRRLEPIDPDFGYGRGKPVDRHYIEQFFAAHAADIHGRVLEIGDSTYTRRFGGDRVTKREVLHVRQGNPEATIVADLAHGDVIPSDSFDCVILPQTLQFVYDVPAALRTVHRILKPGGVALATFPGISHLSRDEWRDAWCWNFTAESARRRFEEAFGPDGVRIETHGNVLATISFLHGIAAEELADGELDFHDPQYPMLIAVRAEKKP